MRGDSKSGALGKTSERQLERCRAYAHYLGRSSLQLCRRLGACTAHTWRLHNRNMHSESDTCLGARFRNYRKSKESRRRKFLLREFRSAQKFRPTTTARNPRLSQPDPSPSLWLISLSLVGVWARLQQRHQLPESGPNLADIGPSAIDDGPNFTKCGATSTEIDNMCWRRSSLAESNSDRVGSQSPKFGRTQEPVVESRPNSAEFG